MAREIPTSEETRKLMIDQEGNLTVREAFLSKDVKTNSLTEDPEEINEELEKANRLKNRLESYINTLNKYALEQNAVHLRDRSK